MGFRLKTEIAAVDNARDALKDAGVGPARSGSAEPQPWNDLKAPHLETLTRSLIADLDVPVSGPIRVLYRGTESEVPGPRVDAKKLAADLLDAQQKLDEKWGRNASRASTSCLVAIAFFGWLAGKNHWLERTKGAGDNQFQALEWAAPITCALLLAVGVIFVGHRNGGVVRFLVGADNRYSTSSVQVALWTVAVVFAFVMFIVQMAQHVTFTNDDAFGSFNSDYLFLLGGPFAAALLAKFAAVTKVNDQSVQQSAATVPAAMDVVTDHSGATSLTDAQFFLFNIVALGYFAVGFAQNAASLPDINQTLIGLTSASALTYVGGKVVNSNPPVITSVSIMSGDANGKVIAGTKLRILGKNFQPAQSKASDTAPAVLFGNLEVTSLDLLLDTEVRVTVPNGLTSGHADVAVRTSHGAASESWKALEV